MSEQSIVVNDLSYSYGNRRAVDHVTFDVAEGEIVGFLGPNGAGKTTMVKMLTGQLVPKNGTASLLGFDVVHDTAEIQAMIGVCFEQTNLYEKMTAEANLTLFADLFGMKRFDATGLLKRVGLEGRERDKVSSYSKGMKQRLMVARAMVSEPKILFLDEPTAGLDPHSAQAIRKLILVERDRGATIFLTTHDMVEADKISDRVAFMNQGSIVAMDTPRALKQKYGSRAIVAETTGDSGAVDRHQIELDDGDAPERVKQLLLNEDVITLHSKEATLEDIFIQITGRGLVE